MITLPIQHALSAKPDETFEAFAQRRRREIESLFENCSPLIRINPGETLAEFAERVGILAPVENDRFTGMLKGDFPPEQ